MSPGTASEAEADELFVVLSDRAHISVPDRPGARLARGDVVRLTAGDETVWTVTGTVRKVCLSP